MHSLVEVVGGGGRAQLTPERVHRLVAVKPVIAREGEQLHQLARLLQAPGPIGDSDSVNGGRKSAEERQTNLAHRHANLTEAAHRQAPGHP